MDYDLIVVGSGPVGAAMAWAARRANPAASILMVEAGKQVTPRPGMSARNLPLEARAVAEKESEVDGWAAPEPGPWTPEPRPGMSLVDPRASLRDPIRDMPAAAVTACVGGQATHWTCACPRPGNTERIPFIPSAEMDALLGEAEKCLHITPAAYPDTAVRTAVQGVLSSYFDGDRPPDRRVQPMPFAAAPEPGGRPRWYGADSMLEELLAGRGFALRPRSLAQRLLIDDTGTVAALELRDLDAGTVSIVTAKSFAIAADAFRTPQLLWASGIRPPALGHYLNDHTRVTAVVYLDPSLAHAEPSLESPTHARELVTGVSWVPFHAPTFPFSATITQREPASGFRSGGMSDATLDDKDPRPVVSIGIFIPKDVRYEDAVTFTDDERDSWGMPGIRITYDLTATDHQRLDRALAIASDLVERLGEPAEGGEPHMPPTGSSLHYQGTVRMGAGDDGSSVCDSNGQVWGFDNLFLGGNGVIPTETASNPTLTSVALGLRAGQHLAQSM